MSLSDTLAVASFILYYIMRGNKKCLLSFICLDLCKKLKVVIKHWFNYLLSRLAEGGGSLMIVLEIGLRSMEIDMNGIGIECLRRGEGVEN